MKRYKLDTFKKGWFIGNFEPSLVKTKEFEIGVKQYKKGDKDEIHYHKVAQEYTVIVSGKFLVNGDIYELGDIIFFEPNDVSDFSCIEDGSTTVIKIPSVKGDKYLVE